MEPNSAPDLLWVFAQIVMINVVLSGDNAVVIALACRSLPPQQRKKAFLLGAIGAVVLRVVFTLFAAYLLGLPYIELAGSVLLLWIGIKLLLPEQGGGDVDESAHLFEAVKTIIVADIVMSLDNVLGIAGAAQGHIPMLVLGLVTTIPLILFGSAMIMKLMERFPFVVTLGGALLGYVAGEMAVADLSVAGWIEAEMPILKTVVPIAGAAIVVTAGKAITRWSSKQDHAKPVRDPYRVE